MRQVGFIGIGNMGGALLRAVCGKIGGDAVAVCDRDSEKTAAAHANYGCSVCTASELAGEVRYLFLGVKPQMMADMLAGIRSDLAKRKGQVILVSMAAGLTMETIRQMAGGMYPVIRIMPNLPAAVGEGMILCTKTSDVEESVFDTFKQWMSLSGRLDEVSEAVLDAGSAVSGCGPAYAAMMIEALADGAVACGVPRGKAMLYAEQMMLGTAKYLLETGIHPAQLKDNVTSPAGTTIQGVRVLEEAGFRGACMDAVIAAYDKNMALAEGK